MNTLLIDFDDTLIDNKSAYYIPKLDATRAIVASLGRFSPRPEEIMDMATTWQRNDIKEKGKITADCFPLAYMHTYRHLCEKFDLLPNPEIMRVIIEIAKGYVKNHYELLPNVVETLVALKNKKKILVTRGNKEVQSLKLEITKLDEYFDAIEIVAQKTPEQYEKIINIYNLKADETVMIGDSLQHDIVPALMAGLHTIHVSGSEDNWDKIVSPELSPTMMDRYH